MTRLLRPMRWPLIGLLLIALFAGCASLDEQQRKWILMPTERSMRWSGGSTDGMVDVWIEHRSAAVERTVKLHALWHAHDDPAAPVLLYLHGARRTVDGSAFRIRSLRELGFSVLAVDYRGFGRSTEALPSEEELYEDARAAWGWLAARHADRPRVIYGHSLGGAVAVHLASEIDDARGLVVEGSFTSIPAVVRTMAWGWLPVGPLITQRYDAASRIARVRMPIVVVHGSEDRVIRPELGRELFELAQVAAKRFVLVEGGTHFSTSARGLEQVRAALRELFGLRV